MNTYRIAAIPGNGIGTEVIAAGLEVLAALATRDGGFRIDPADKPVFVLQKKNDNFPQFQLVRLDRCGMYHCMAVFPVSLS